ncbi:MAG: hypothetical protein ABIB71_00575 [Candidatus Woesearchaeota archaeon]
MRDATLEKLAKKLLARDMDGWRREGMKYSISLQLRDGMQMDSFEVVVGADYIHTQHFEFCSSSEMDGEPFMEVLAGRTLIGRLDGGAATKLYSILEDRDEWPEEAKQKPDAYWLRRLAKLADRL